MEATSTRRAGLERFTFPKKSKPYFVLDLANDLPGTFAGGSMNIDTDQGRITFGGLWGSRYVSRVIRCLIWGYVAHGFLVGGREASTTNRSLVMIC